MVVASNKKRELGANRKFSSTHSTFTSGLQINVPCSVRSRYHMVGMKVRENTQASSRRAKQLLTVLNRRHLCQAWRGTASEMRVAASGFDSKITAGGEPDDYENKHCRKIYVNKYPQYPVIM